jgi:cobaltochelatase CobN
VAADIVFLSAADSELTALARLAAERSRDAPTVHLSSLAGLADPASIEHFVDHVARNARLVVVRAMGGTGYWPDGLQRLRALADTDIVALAVVPGEPRWDASLDRFATVPPERCRLLWRYLVEGGAENGRRALAFMDHLIGAGPEPPPPLILPRAGFYSPRKGVVAADEAFAAIAPADPVAAVVFYRALLDGEMLAPIDALVAALAAEGLAALPVFVASLKEPHCEAVIAAAFARRPPAIVLNATAFAVSRIGEANGGTVLDHPGVPVLQVILAGSSEQAWRENSRGLSASDLTMNVAMPEIDGRLTTRAISFKMPHGDDSPGTTYRPVADRVAFVARQAKAWVTLAATAPHARRVALVLGNYPDGDGRIGNGVGLDTPASTVAIADGMRAAGYAVDGFPATSAALMAGACDRTGIATLSLADYGSFFATLPPAARAAVNARWGSPEDDPDVAEGAFHIRAHVFGNVALGVQPARGYGLDPQSSLHDPDVVPPHHYLAFYAWLRGSFGAGAIVHVGKHGNLEWLPGKALGLSDTCWPEIALGPTPLIYPFIVNDPGEGTAAKRRTSAVIVDHLMPPMTRAELHAGLAELETMVDEYALAAPVDPRRAAYLATTILDAAARHGLDRDLGLTRHGDEDDAVKVLDAHLCELKEMQIRDGLHVLGTSPTDRQRIDTLVAIARTPRSGGRAAEASLHRAIADDLALEFDPLDCQSAAPWSGLRPSVLAEVRAAPWRTMGDTVERIELLAARLVEGVGPNPGPRTTAVLDWIARDLAPALDRCGSAERQAVLAALAGRFVPPGPSGAPTRGRADVLPTGRNFYSIDVRAMPTAAAWRLGRASAEMLARRYRDDEGRWPRSIAMSAWATSNMRTGGDDVAQVMALMGAEPTWEATTGRVTGFRVIPPGELGRPRVDVTLKISGMFRDAFPGAIDLIDSAAHAIAALDEADETNPLAANRRTASAAGVFRIFGSKPGAYGAGLQAPIDEGAWDARADLADVFLSWGSFAYGAGSDGSAARDAFVTRLRDSDAAFQAQDNREHDILDSDDYYQFLGGLAATIQTLKGAAPRIYFGDHARPEKPVVRGLGEEIARVVRGRAANPKWIAGMARHGYKGAFEIAATVDYLFAFAATTDAVADHHFDALYDAYVADAGVAGFMADANPAALAEMAARFREAIDRGLWSPRSNSAYDRLTTLIARREAAE